MLETAVLRFALAHLGIVTGFALLFRVYLMIVHWGFDTRSALFGLAAGFVFDLAVGVYSFLPFLALTLAWPKKFWRSVRPRLYFALLLTLELFFFAFVCVGEYFFYDEFKDRFNFIAVDYLVYTHEVLGNIFESYPVVPVVLALAVFSFALAWLLSGFVVKDPRLAPASGQKRAVMFGSYGILFAGLLVTMQEQRMLGSANFAEELLAKNGVHALFAAYRHNEINFDRFYTTTDSDRAASFVHDALEGSHLIGRGVEDNVSIVRNLVEPKPMIRKNVVLVIMESLSARFMKSYGNPNDLTPNLDRLAREGLFYDRIYATGTRTVRGLEAIILSIPPTPGQSIVRRPAGTGIFNIGSVFRDHDYDVNFIYGGRAMFDNMGAFFEGNGFKVLDQSTFPSGEVSFTNAWGVADEDLFDQVIKAGDASGANGRRFFHAVLTTSNHRPYTYPEGKVAIPSGKGRDGAVQYADYAIGKFIEKAERKPWFKDTVFVFVADHNASVAGQAKIDPNDYLVPMIVYAPGFVKPQTVHHMGSQIDLAPTLMELLSASYQSRFFGMELQDDNPGRAFLGTYQSVGYLTENSLTVLSPNRKIERWSWEGKNLTLVEKHVWATLPEENAEAFLPAVAYYKTASDWFGKRLLEDRKRFGEQVNLRD